MTENSMSVRPDLSETSLLRWNKDALNLLLKDRTTGKNIRWGTDNYNSPMLGFESHAEMKANLITGWYEGLIRPRAEKDNETQIERTRNKAEVFTPSWVIKIQVDAVLEDFSDLSLEEFLHTKWLEITCGEAPYIANRYDMITGKIIALDDRAGFMDVKFQRLHNEIDDHDTWVKLALIIYQSSYGYEYQGDSLLLARENLLLTFVDNYFYQFGAPPSDDLLLEVTDIISKNVFQMDGLSYEIPYSNDLVNTQLGFIDANDVEFPEPTDAEIYRWDLQKKIKLKEIPKGGKEMKFDVVIGNPPYQISSEVNNRQDPIYHYFYQSAEEISDKYILISPARFLFNGGLTPKVWNLKMLNDPYLDVLYYNPNSSMLFPSTEIKGGIAICYRDSKTMKKPIEVFLPNTMLRNIAKRFKNISVDSIDKIMYGGRSDLLFNELFLIDYPESIKQRLAYIQMTRPKVQILGKNEEYELKTSTFSALPNVFIDSDSDLYNSHYRLLGLLDGKRVWRWIEQKYMEPRRQNHNINNYKVFLTEANGSGSFGEALSQPVIGRPYESSTSTFISIGNFNSQLEALSCSKYIKTKFTRALLGIKKITQHNSPSVWSFVPLQDFTPDSDIDWTKSIPEIDQQLYKKYNLSDEEIDFIETHVKEME